MTKRYIVSGRVQGVGFRWYTEREAQRIGVAGWVRNTEEGTVEVLASGTSEQHAELRLKLEQGPRASRVDEVQELEAEAGELASSTEFSIRGAW